MERKNLTIDELVSAVHQKMLNLKYCEGHLLHCRECWHILQKYATNKCELYLTIELGVVFLREYIPKTFTQEQIKKILASVDRGNDRGKRDYAILLLVTIYGLRVSDIRNLEFANLDFTASRLRLIQQKTKKPIEHELLPDVGWTLIDYIKNGRPKTDCKKIFVLHKAPYGGFAQDNNLGQIIYRYALASGVT